MKKTLRALLSVLMILALAGGVANPTDHDR